MDDWPDIRFTDDRDGCLFTATVRRKEAKSSLKTPAKTPVKTPVKTGDRILMLLNARPGMTLAETATAIGKSLRAVERASAKLVKERRLRYVGPRKGGHWEIIDKTEG